MLTAAGSIVFASTLLGFAGRFWWVFDLFSHFRVQYLLSISLIIILLLPARSFRASAVLALCAAINLASILPYYFSPGTKSDSNHMALMVISINVNTANQQFDLVRQFITENSPDLILLMEVNAAWATALEEIRPAYPYQISEPREDNFGIVLYSKLPFIRCEPVYLGRAGVPTVIGELDIAGQRLTLVGTHPLPPISNAYSELRNNQIEAVAEYMASVSGPKVLLGDLNVSPWSYYFGRLLRISGLSDSSKGRGIGPTWPTKPIWMRIPIDFCLVSKEIVVKERWIGPDIGSDHFPLVVEFALSL